MDQVTQQNASSSEEMAATAEELASQVEQLLSTIGFSGWMETRRGPEALLPSRTSPPLLSGHP